MVLPKPHNPQILDLLLELRNTPFRLKLYPPSLAKLLKTSPNVTSFPMAVAVLIGWDMCQASNSGDGKHGLARRKNVCVDQVGHVPN